jgi:hypothetical protein
MRASRVIGLAVVTVVLLAGCGGSSAKLGDGQWYGKLVSVDASGRRVEFEPACHLLYASGRWVARGGGARFTLGVATHRILKVYYRPGGKVSAGYAQSADLGQLTRVVAHGRLPDFLPGWFIAVRGGAVTAVAEDSGLEESSAAAKQKLACVQRAARHYSSLQLRK